MRYEHEQEWEPGAALASALEEIPLIPGLVYDEHRTRLEPYLREALGALADLEWRRELSVREHTRVKALGMLLESVVRAER